MIRRLFWALLGLGLGLVLGARLVRAVDETRDRARPSNLAAGAGRSVGQAQSRLQRALDEGRAAAREREALLRDRFGVPSIDELAADVEAQRAAGDDPTDPTRGA